MDPEDKQILKKTLELSRENNKMLHSIKKQMFYSRIFRIIYWAILLGAAIGLYYYIDPYINQIIDIYGGVKGGVQNIGDIFR